VTQSSPQLPNSPAGHAPRKKYKKWLPWVLGLAAFLLGVGVGNTDSANPTSSEQYTTLQADLQSEQERRSDLADDLAEARADVEAAAASPETRSAELDERSAELDRRAAELAAQEQALRAAEQAASAPTPAPAPTPVPAPAPDPVPAPVPETPSSGSVYYENCTAARDAGDAPVRVGDPGYGRHLDSDGDGIGCE